MIDSPFDVFLAAAPLLAVLVLMVGFRWGGSKAGPAGWFVALVIAVARFGAGLDVIGYAHVRSLFLTLDVVYIVWAALLLYHVVDQAGGLQVIAAWFTRLTGDDVLRVLLLGWVFASFLQGVGGFGVPVAVVAPLLVGLGLPALAAVVVPSIGHAWAVTFGSLASSFIVLIGATGLEADALAPPAAILLGASAFGCGLLAAHAYAGWRGVRRALPAVLSVGLAMAVGQYLLATHGIWNIAAAGGSLAGLVVGLGVTRLPWYRRVEAPATPAAAPASANPGNPETQTTRGLSPLPGPLSDPLPEERAARANRPAPSFPLAIAGYVILAALAVLITGVAPVKDFMGGFRVTLPVPEVRTVLDWVTPASDLSFKVLGHTGAVLVYSALIAFVLYRWRGYTRPGVSRAILAGMVRMGLSPALGILSMVGMATIMSYAGMTRALAEWLSGAVPPDLYAFVATAIGTLGAFMTGSNTNSNAVFAALQQDTAALLGLSVTMVLGAQTASAAIASLLAPAKIIVGASTVGLGGDEGAVLRRLLAYGGALLLLIAVLAFLLLRLGY